MVKRTEVPDEFRNTGPTATERQLEYLKALRDGKDLTTLTVEQIVWLNEADLDTFPSEYPKDRISKVIETLVELPWKKRDASFKPTVADGRYAVE